MRTEVGDDQAEIAWVLPIIGGALVLAMILASPREMLVYDGVVTDQDVLDITQKHCVSCHAVKPSNATFKTPPKNVMLENLDDLRLQKQRIITQSVNGRAMPMGNKTGITIEERAKLGAWLAKQ